MKKFYNVLSVFALVAVFATLAAAQAPSAPSNLAVRAHTEAGVWLEWDAASGAQFYRVFKSVDGSPFVGIAATEHLNFIDWLISRDHEFRYYVRGYDHDLGGPTSDTVSFHDFPPPPNDVHGVITGRVVDDSSGMPVREARVSFFAKDGYWRVNVHTDTAGNYWAPLDTGRYRVRAERVGYVPEWFDDAMELSSATVVSLHQDTVTADFGLTPRPVSVPVTFTGVVRDSLTGAPLANALVIYLRPPFEQRLLEHELGMFGGFDWERFDLPILGRLHGVVWCGFTDSSGAYAAHLRSNQRYIAMAFTPGYIHKFFFNKLTPFDADRLSSSGDLSGIDFELVANPLASLFLSGTVHDTTNSGVMSHVVLVRLTAVGPRVVRYRSTDSLGNYAFGNLVPGVFMVKAVPVSFFAPAWYAASGCGIRNWHAADTVRLTGDRSGVDICVLGTPDRGCGRVAGMITSAGNVFSSAGAQGVTVYAVSTTTGEVGGYGVSEDDGSFLVENLAPGTYDIVVDQEGYSANSTPAVTVQESNDFQVMNTSITISQDVVASARDRAAVVPDRYRLDQNFPNPFNPTTTIGFTVPAPSVVVIKVYNLIGQEVALLANATMEAGVHRVQWNGKDHAGRGAGSGIYFVKMSAVSVDKKSEFAQTRKIVLMK